MSAETIETRLAVVEHETRTTIERIDRELATKADVQAAKNETIRWMVGLILGLMLVQPVAWLGVIMAAQRLGLLAP